MNKATLNKAMQLVRNQNIKLVKEDSTWTRMHFKVTNLLGVASNVWRVEKKGVLEWHCDSRTTGGFGCVMTNPFQKEPQCSHTLSCELYLRNMKMETFKKIGDIREDSTGKI